MSMGSKPVRHNCNLERLELLCIYAKIKMSPKNNVTSASSMHFTTQQQNPLQEVVVCPAYFHQLVVKETPPTYSVPSLEPN
ncbi:unnamed protein product [Fusarium venenatum]|uniref:Uncharacterized protein n=1 Tax=Fusarium venenatum TaxID=56646 RepID=A0A2L2SWR7_9HYPO|nr:uncharacterized protein FVRRES_06670 [Fusarium venenatum]CEI62234.1 unnamed protein product [Fusarium venenatum]